MKFSALLPFSLILAATAAGAMPQDDAGDGQITTVPISGGPTKYEPYDPPTDEGDDDEGDEPDNDLVDEVEELLVKRDPVVTLAGGPIERVRFGGQEDVVPAAAADAEAVGAEPIAKRDEDDDDDDEGEGEDEDEEEVVEIEERDADADENEDEEPEDGGDDEGEEEEYEGEEEEKE